MLQSGDIVFFEGRRWRSAAVKALEPGPGAMTHLGIIVRDSHTINLVHASPYTNGRGTAGVRREPLGAFLRRERPAMRAYRCSVDSLRDKAARWASARARDAVPFDSRFDATSDSALYCTEFVWKAYRACGLDLAESMFDTLRHPFGRLTVLFPRGLAMSPYLERVSMDMARAEAASPGNRRLSRRWQ